MKEIFRIVLGDSSCDGHCTSESYRIVSNKPYSYVEKAFTNALQQSGYKSVYEFPCSNYQDNYISISQLELFNLDWRKYFLPEEKEEGDVFAIDSDIYLAILLDFIKTGDSELELNVEEYEHVPALIRGVGYGLYNN